MRTWGWRRARDSNTRLRAGGRERRLVSRNLCVCTTRCRIRMCVGGLERRGDALVFGFQVIEVGGCDARKGGREGERKEGREGGKNIQMTPPSNKLLIRFPRVLVELFRGCPLTALLGLPLPSFPVPLSILPSPSDWEWGWDLCPARIRLFRSICGVSPIDSSSVESHSTGFSRTRSPAVLFFFPVPEKSNAGSVPAPTNTPRVQGRAGAVPLPRSASCARPHPHRPRGLGLFWRGLEGVWEEMWRWEGRPGTFWRGGG